MAQLNLKQAAIAALVLGAATPSFAQDTTEQAAVQDARAQAGLTSGATAKLKIISPAELAHHLPRGKKSYCDKTDPNHIKCFSPVRPGLEVDMDANGASAAQPEPSPVMAGAKFAPPQPTSGSGDFAKHFLAAADLGAEAAAKGDGSCVTQKAVNVGGNFISGKINAVNFKCNPVANVLLAVDKDGNPKGDGSSLAFTSIAQPSQVIQRRGLIDVAAIVAGQVFAPVLSSIGSYKFGLGEEYLGEAGKAGLLQPKSYYSVTNTAQGGAVSNTNTNTNDGTGNLFGNNNGLIGSNVTNSGCGTIGLGYASAAGGASASVPGTSYLGTGDLGGINGTSSLGTNFGTTGAYSAVGTAPSSLTLGSNTLTNQESAANACAPNTGTGYSNNQPVESSSGGASNLTTGTDANGTANGTAKGKGHTAIDYRDQNQLGMNIQLAALRPEDIVVGRPPIVRVKAYGMNFQTYPVA